MVPTSRSPSPMRKQDNSWTNQRAAAAEGSPRRRGEAGFGTPKFRGWGGTSLSRSAHSQECRGQGSGSPLGLSLTTPITLCFGRPCPPVGLRRVLSSLSLCGACITGSLLL